MEVQEEAVYYLSCVVITTPSSSHLIQTHKLNHYLEAIASCTISMHPILVKKTKRPFDKWGTYKNTFHTPKIYFWIFFFWNEFFVLRIFLSEIILFFVSRFLFLKILPDLFFHNILFSMTQIPE